MEEVRFLSSFYYWGIQNPIADEPFLAPFFSPALPGHAAKIFHKFTQVKQLAGYYNCKTDSPEVLGRISFVLLAFYYCLSLLLLQLPPTFVMFVIISSVSCPYFQGNVGKGVEGGGSP